MARWGVSAPITPTYASTRSLVECLGIVIARELTAVDGNKSNGGVERQIALVSKDAKSAWPELPLHFPGVEFRRHMLNLSAV